MAAEGKATTSTDIHQTLMGLSQDYSALSARIRALKHSVTCQYHGVTFRLHFPAFRADKPTIGELVEVIALYILRFALPRKKIVELHAEYSKLTPDQYDLRIGRLRQEAIELFKKAQKATNRNGEAGELLLYLLTEWVLGAPQLIAKMSLKTNPDMPVHGVDGIHIGYSKSDRRLVFYWGESKIYSNPSSAISAAIESVSTALSAESLGHELHLVEKHIDLSGLSEDAKKAILEYLDPMTEASNQRIDVATCLIGFDFDGYAKVQGLAIADVEMAFEAAALSELNLLGETFAKALKGSGLETQTFEIFFFPFPSAQQFRDAFQSKIGWES